MHELGYVEGKNLLIEWRFADGDYLRLPAMAAELVKLKVDVILALSPPGVIAAQKATTTIPIVFVVPVDPVGAGFVKSLAQPGRQQHRDFKPRRRPELEAPGNAADGRAQALASSGARESRQFRSCHDPEQRRGGGAKSVRKGPAGEGTDACRGRGRVFRHCP